MQDLYSSKQINHRMTQSFATIFFSFLFPSPCIAIWNQEHHSHYLINYMDNLVAFNSPFLLAWWIMNSFYYSTIASIPMRLLAGPPRENFGSSGYSGVNLHTHWTRCKYLLIKKRTERHLLAKLPGTNKYRCICIPAKKCPGLIKVYNYGKQMNAAYIAKLSEKETSISRS